MNPAKLFLVLALAATPALAESAVAPEVNPPGDIPDSQVFIKFVSPNGFSLKVPEGWARKDEAAITTFSDKYNQIAIAYISPSAPVDEATAQALLVPDLLKTGRAVSGASVKTFKVGSATAVLITYSSNSEPNGVTNKQVREEDEKLIYSKGDKRVEVTLSAPKGADNADQWDLIAKSFRWK